MSYDPLGRLHQVSSPSGTTRFEYDGVDLVAEYDASGNRLRRYVHGPGLDEPLAWYEGSWTLSRRFLIADERGSIVGAFDGAGSGIGYNAYDEYGRTQTTWGNAGRFGYTGQAWIPELGLYYYKVRFYYPRLGRFMQADPIGYEDGMNLYAYVGGDPVNFTDPLGLQAEDDCGVKRPKNCPTVFVDGFRRGSGTGSGSGGQGFNSASGDLRPNEDIDGDGRPDPDILITGTRRPQVVVKTTFKGTKFLCEFVGGRQFTVSARNLQPNVDGIEIGGQSFGIDDRGEVIPSVSRPSHAYTVQGGHLVGFRNTHFDFEATSMPNGNPSFHRVFIQGTIRRGGAPTLIQIQITTNGATSGCV